MLLSGNLNISINNLYMTNQLNTLQEVCSTTQRLQTEMLQFKKKKQLVLEMCGRVLKCPYERVVKGKPY